MTLHVNIASPDLKRCPWNLNLIKNVKDTVVYLTQKVLNLYNISPLFLLNNKCASCLETTNSYLIKQSFHGYRCKSGIAIFTWRVTWINAFSLFNLLFRNYLELWRLGETVQGSGAVGSNLPLSREPVKLIQVSGSNLPLSREPVKLIQGSGSSLPLSWEPVQLIQVSGSNLPLSREPVKLIQVFGSNLPLSREPVKLIQVSGSSLHLSREPVKLI